MVDEARDESKKEQMSIVLRFVDKDGYVQERFFGVVHVKDTIASTLKECIFSVLSRHTLDVQNIRGQGYDGASNMRGEWNGLQALILGECPYAYYVHCFAHRLQLALVAASKEVIPVHHFFTKLNSIINVVSASSKRNDQLKATHASNIAHLLNINDLESGKGLNQIGSLQRAVLLNIIDDGTTPAQRGDADAAYESQDILNAMHLVSSTKLLIQKLRDDGWDELVADMKSFCQALSIPIPDFNAQYIARRGRAHHQQDEITVDHH
ncbi:zinc finger MYM-type protein 1-like [Zingiber officinale]|uniref:zinc finger MYM-type protein 1-like n=1 Tax=Zingiber officinale TaxID=94328 RepID=UPI001C4C769F|nr:zinc finger MYM-type protein 1-like [Zingiber officinale]